MNIIIKGERESQSFTRLFIHLHDTVMTVMDCKHIFTTRRHGLLNICVWIIWMCRSFHALHSPYFYERGRGGKMVGGPCTVSYAHIY